MLRDRDSVALLAIRRKIRMARDTRGAKVAELGSGPDLAEERVQIHRRIRTVVPSITTFRRRSDSLVCPQFSRGRGEKVVNLRIVVNLQVSSKRLDLRFRFMLAQAEAFCNSPGAGFAVVRF